jgi:hypothetical protein
VLRAARDAGLAASGPSGPAARCGRRSGAGWPSGASVPHTSWRHQPSLVARGHGSDWVKCGPYAGFGIGVARRGAGRWLAASGPSGRVARRGRRSGAAGARPRADGAREAARASNPSGASVPHTSWRHQPSLVARGHGSDWVKCGPYAGFGIGVARRGAGRWLAASGPSGRVARRGRRSGAAGARPRADGAREAARASNPSGAGRRAVAIARSAPCSVRGGSSRARASPRSRAARAQSALESGRAARSHVGP